MTIQLFKMGKITKKAASNAGKTLAKDNSTKEQKKAAAKKLGKFGGQ